MQEFLEIGQIVNTFGIKGMVKIKPFTDDINRFDRLKKVYVVNKTSKKEYEIEEVKYHKDMVLMKLKGIDKVEFLFRSKKRRWTRIRRWYILHCRFTSD